MRKSSSASEQIPSGPLGGIFNVFKKIFQVASPLFFPATTVIGILMKVGIEAPLTGLNFIDAYFIKGVLKRELYFKERTEKAREIAKTASDAVLWFPFNSYKELLSPYFEHKESIYNTDKQKVGEIATRVPSHVGNIEPEPTRPVDKFTPNPVFNTSPNSSSPLQSQSTQGNSLGT